MGVCCAKKQFKDTESKKIEVSENNLNIANLNSEKITYDALNKYYNKMLEPLKLLAVKMCKNDTIELDHNYKSSGNSTNISALKGQIKKIQAEVKLLHKQLPVQLTNSIFVRQAVSHQNFFKALISGSDNTPYANGLFLYDIYLPDDYPNQCPKMQLMTTGGNSIRFNPNLYSNGYVCLSLLGTWRGDVSESWDPQISNLLQVLLSIQSLVMSEGVYYNEPLHQNDFKTKKGRALNIGYSNIVRYATVKYAINHIIEYPPNGFEDVVNKHFSIKANLIIKTLNKWVDTAKRDNSNAKYTQLVEDHNPSLSFQFRSYKSNYYNKLKNEVEIATKHLQRLQNEIGNQIEEYFMQEEKNMKNKENIKKEKKDETEEMRKKKKKPKKIKIQKKKKNRMIQLNEMKQKNQKCQIKLLLKLMNKKKSPPKNKIRSWKKKNLKVIQQKYRLKIKTIIKVRIKKKKTQFHEKKNYNSQNLLGVIIESILSYQFTNFGTKTNYCNLFIFQI